MPWVDRKSPREVIRHWLTQPSLRAHIVFAYGFAACTLLYAWVATEDGRMVYMQNTAIQTRMLQESAISAAAQERVNLLETAIKKGPTTPAPTDSAINYELELARERGRAAEIEQRNSDLLKELLNLRRQVKEIQRQRDSTNEETEKLRKLVVKLQDY